MKNLRQNLFQVCIKILTGEPETANINVKISKENVNVFFLNQISYWLFLFYMYYYYVHGGEHIPASAYHLSCTCIAKEQQKHIYYHGTFIPKR